MSSGNVWSFSSLGIKNTNIKEASGVKLTDNQKVIVGSVLDLFEGKPTLKHLSLWSRDATFADPLTDAKGLDRFAAQWYGLPVVFRPIALQSHQVTSAGNPIEVELRNKYTVRGINKDQVVDSTVRIFVSEDGDSKIERVEDRWNGKLTEGAISEVSVEERLGGSRSRNEEKMAQGSLGTTVGFLNHSAGWFWWSFCVVSWWPLFLAFRKLNAVAVSGMVKVPQDEAEDMKMKAEREREQ